MVASRAVGIIGAGAVGSYVGGRLAQNAGSGEPPLAVTLLGRQAQVDAIARHGLVVRSSEGDTISYPAVSVSAAGMHPFDLVVLCVRNYDVTAALADVRSLMGEFGLVLTLQNGVGSEQTLADALGPDRIIVGTLTSSVISESPGVVRRTSATGGVALATMSHASVPDWIVHALTASGVATSTLPRYRSLLWSKLLLNMLGAATSAIVDIDLSDLVKDPRLFRMEQLAFREATSVMDRLGIQTVDLPGYSVSMARRAMRLPPPIAQRLIGPRMARSRGGRPPAMRADIKRGKTEVRWLNGAVVEAARGAHVQTPVNTALSGLTESLAVDPELRVGYARQPDNLVSFMRHQGISL